MPVIIVDHQAIDVAAGTRLVLAIEDANIPILHRCGGYAKCTTCRVEFLEGEPPQMTEAEKLRLQNDPDRLYGRIRLSCQILCEQDMTLKTVMRMDNSSSDSPGKRPEDVITPDAVWTSGPKAKK